MQVSEEIIEDLGIRYSSSQESLLPSETMSQFAEPVIPDEPALGGEIRNLGRVQYNKIVSESLNPSIRTSRTSAPAERGYFPENMPPTQLD
jgi:hypothetical protein